jgi:hypothetical protein
MSSDGYGCLHLLKPVVEIHMGNIILCRVIVWITFDIIILDLEPCGYTLLTEGDFIPSATADNKTRRQVELICKDNFVHHLG